MSKRIGRPPKDIDPAHVKRMAAIGCTNTEIADVLGCDEGVIRRRFAAVLLEARAEMRMTLRRKQYQLAMKGDRTMLIWLGKNLLGQVDKPEDLGEKETPEQRAAAIRVALTAMRDADGTEAAA